MNLVGSLNEGFFSSGGLQVVGEETSAFRDDSSGFFVFSNFLFEFGVLFFSFSIKLISVFVVILEFSILGLNDSLVDLLSGVKVSFELCLKNDSLSVAISQILIESFDVHVASTLEISVCCIVFLLLSNISFLKIIKGSKESLKGF